MLDHDPERPDWGRARPLHPGEGPCGSGFVRRARPGGLLPREELLTLRKLGTRLQGHPDSNLVPGVEVSTGSLGQGLSVAAGSAAGLKAGRQAAERVRLARRRRIARKGAGMGRAAMFAAHRNLDNLVAVVDRNCLQIDGDTADVCDPGDLAAKFQAFGWDAREVDGTTWPRSWRRSLRRKADRAGKAHALIARTVKGKGVSFMENQAG